MRERSCMASSQWMTAFGRRLFQGCRNRSPSHGIFPGEHMSISPETNVPTHGRSDREWPEPESESHSYDL